MFSRFALASLLAFAAGCSHEGSADVHSASIAQAATARAASAPMAIVQTPVVHGFAVLPDRGELLAYPTNLSRRDGAYTWRRTELSEAHALNAIANGHLRVTAPSGELLDFQYDRHLEHPSGDWTWVGHLAGHDGEQTILTFGEHAAFGSIAQPGKLPLRLTVRDGVAWLVETDPRKIATIINAATRPQRRDYLVPPKSAVPPAVGDGAAGFRAMGAAPAMAGAGATTTTVDLVLGYSAAFASANGGTSGAITRLNNLVDTTNIAYGNSQIDAQLRLVATVSVNYPDATSNKSTLENLTGFDSTSNVGTTPDPAFNALRAAREQYGADLVAMVRSFRTPENEGCGISWLIGGGQSGISTSDSYFGYSVISDGTDQDTSGKSYFCREETLAHELGHNMGGNHDVAASKGADGVLDPEDYGAYSYSFGYKTTATTGNFFTVMAYGDTGQTSYRIFSNPRSTFCGGFACGTTTQADNARTLSQTIPTVATFRASVVATTTATTRNDVNGDGKSDLLFHNATTRQFSDRVMDGTTTVSSQLIGGVGSGYTIAATGDFNGDGRLDMVWTSAALDLYMWLGNSTGFTSLRFGTYPSGWRVVGSGDVDGDGKADLIFHNPNTRQFSYRIMDGTRLVRAQLINGVGSGYRVAAIGDFNGDGRTDLVWTSAALDLYMWLGDGTSFVSTRVGAYPPGWTVAGAGDVDADGKADLLFHNAETRQFSYRVMSGTATVRSQLIGGVGAGYRVATIGDFNADGKVDIVWTSAALDLYIWLGNGMSFSSSRAGAYPSGWAVIP